jgi:hypothetical protein
LVELEFHGNVIHELLLSSGSWKAEECPVIRQHESR